MKWRAVVVVCGLLVLVRIEPVTQRVWRNPSLGAWFFGAVALDATYTPTPVKSITDIVVQLNPAVTSASQTVAVRRASSLLVYSGHSHDCGIQAMSAWAQGNISSDTTVTVARVGTDCTVIYTAQLVEYLANFVKSQQCGSIQMTAGQSGNSVSTASTIVPAKTILAQTGVSTDMTAAVQSQPAADQMARLSKTATVISAVRGATRNMLNVGYCYVELP